MEINRIRKIDYEIQGFQQHQLGRGKFGDVAAISGQGSKGVEGDVLLALAIDKFSRVDKLKVFFKRTCASSFKTS